MDKASWVDAFVLHMIELGAAPRKLGELAENLWPHLGNLDPEKAAQAEHALGDSGPGGFPDTEFNSM